VYAYNSNTINDLYLSVCYPLEIHFTPELRNPHLCTLVSYFIYYTNARVSPILHDSTIYEKHSKQCTTTTYLHINEHLIKTLLDTASYNYWLLTEFPSDHYHQDDHLKSILLDNKKKTINRMYLTNKAIEQEFQQYMKELQDIKMKEKENKKISINDQIDLDIDIEMIYIGNTLPDLLQTQIHNEHVYHDMNHILLIVESYHPKETIHHILQCWYDHRREYPKLTVINNSKYRMELNQYTSTAPSDNRSTSDHGRNEDIHDDDIENENENDLSNHIQILSRQEMSDEQYYLLKRINGIHLYPYPNDNNHYDTFYTSIMETKSLGNCIVTIDSQQSHSSHSHINTGLEVNADKVKHSYNDFIQHGINGYILDLYSSSSSSSSRGNKTLTGIKDVLSKQRNKCFSIDEFLQKSKSYCDDWSDRVRTEYEKEHRIYLRVMKKLNHELIFRRFNREGSNEDDIIWLKNDLDWILKKRCIGM